MVASGKKDKKAKPEIEPPIVNGTFLFPSGDKYDGQYRQDNGVVVRSGQGENYSKGGTVYNGDWENDKMNGKGVLTHPSGAIYEGEFVDNMMHGHGKYSWPDGSKYEGPFYKNMLEGSGKFIDIRGQVWTGKFDKKTVTGLRFELNM